MNTKRTNLKLPGLISTGSFLCILALLFLTSPLKNISYAILSFISLFAFLASSLWLIGLIQSDSIGSKGRYRIFIISAVVTLAVMFKSASALSWLEGLVLVLISFGLLFYSGRRA